jgi:hypothetical protein
MPNSTTTKPCLAVGFAGLLLFISGCATTTLPFPGQRLQQIHSTDDQMQSCRSALATIEHTISEYGVNDAGEQKVDHFPYLRTNRFLAAFSSAELSTEQQQQLFHLLEQTGRHALLTELKNLPGKRHRQLLHEIQSYFPSRATEEVVKLCVRHLAQKELNSTPVGDYVVSRLHVDDNYNTWQRIIGLYYITLFPVLGGIHDWHDETMAIFNTPLKELPVKGSLTRYALDPSGQTMTRQQVAAILTEARNNPLRIPLPDTTQRQQLIQNFAPVWEIDVASRDDRIGVPYWPSSDADTPDINTRNPVIYTQLSHTIFNDEVLLQLNYMIWFPSRPCQSTFDILCGHIDGIIWRVTLSNDGKPLVFDSIHSCGCYHQFFPTPALTMRHNDAWLQEPVLIPKKLPRVAADQHIVIRVADVSHYIDAVTLEPRSSGTPLDTTVVSTQPYDELRSLPAGDNRRRSMFGPSGLVPGTQRAERFILWPMGVPSPGAMRQWGTHATAFVGRRHFDEPCLLEEIFTVNPTRNSAASEQALGKNIYTNICRKEVPVSGQADNQ